MPSPTVAIEPPRRLSPAPITSAPARSPVKHQPRYRGVVAESNEQSSASERMALRACVISSSLPSTASGHLSPIDARSGRNPLWHLHRAASTVPVPNDLV